jgi:hypothetical protein
MKEYIARDEFLKRFNVLYNVLDNLERILYSDSLVELIDIPVADVIEREKIDKAIEEIIERSFISDIYNDRTDDKIIKVDDVVEILKRNIESKEEEEEE